MFIINVHYSCSLCMFIIHVHYSWKYIVCPIKIQNSATTKSAQRPANRLMAVNFTDKERQVLLPAMAVCAKDCYFFEHKHGLDKFATELPEFR